MEITSIPLSNEKIVIETPLYSSDLLVEARNGMFLYKDYC